MTLKEKIDELNMVTGSNFSMEMGKNCIDFYYKEVIGNGSSLLDADEYACLNTILGYDVGREAAHKISKDLWEHDVEMIELDLDPESRMYINKAAKNNGVKLDWSKWEGGVMKEYRFFPET